MPFVLTFLLDLHILNIEGMSFICERLNAHIFSCGEVAQVSTNSIRVDEKTKAETVRIAKEMGLSFNAVVNILLRKFNTDKGFPFPVKLVPKRPVSVFDMSSEEFELACREAVSTRDAVPVAEYTTLLDDETGNLMRKYADGRVEYVLD